jgi:hypothetical protein
VRTVANARMGLPFAAWPSSAGDGQALFDSVTAAVMSRARAVVPFDLAEDAWHAPTQCVLVARDPRGGDPGVQGAAGHYPGQGRLGREPGALRDSRGPAPIFINRASARSGSRSDRLPCRAPPPEHRST